MEIISSSGPEKEKIQWVEIIEPRTQERVYANLITGDCLRDPPPGVPVKKTDDNQWWELFDHNTSRFYYYNATSQRTVWHRPQDCDIIPLAKLQTLKQNTEVRSGSGSSERSTRQSPLPRSESRGTQTLSNGLMSPCNGACLALSRRRMRNAQTQTTPPPSPEAERKSSSSSNSSRRLVDQSTATPPLPLLHGRTRQDSSLADGSLGRRSDCSAGSSSFSQGAPSLERPGGGTPSALSPLHPPRPSPPDLSPRHLPKKGGGGTGDESSSTSSPKHAPLPGSLSSSSSTRLKKAVASPSSASAKGISAGLKNSLGRSFSFMTRKEDKAQRVARERQDEEWKERLSSGGSSASGLRSVDSTPQQRRRQKFLAGLSSSSGSSKKGNDSSALHQQPQQFGGGGCPSKGTGTHHLTDALVTPVMYRKQRSLDLGNIPRATRGVGAAKVNGTSEDGPGSSQSPKDALGQPPLSPPPTRYLSSGVGLLSPSVPPNLPHLSPNTLKAMGESPLTHYLISQGKLSGYGFCNRSRYRSGDSFRSDEEVDGGDHDEDDSDAFADDEGAMSAPEDEDEDDASTGSEQYLDESAYPENERETYGKFEDLPTSFFKYKSPQLVLDGMYENAYRSSDGTSHSIPRNKVASPTGTSTVDSAGRSGIYVEPPTTPIGVPFYAHLAPGDSGTTGSEAAKRELMANFLQQTQRQLVRGMIAVPPGLSEPHIYSPVAADDQSIDSGMGSGNPLERTRLPPPPPEAGELVPDNLNVCKKGIFRKNVPIDKLLSWTKDPISQPLLVTPDRTLRKDKREMFKLIQVYMMDRKAKTGMTVSTVALDLILKALKKDGLKEELFFTLCKQTTENPDRESLRRGWELMATCLTFLLPPTAFVPYLRWYIEKHRHPDLKNIKDVNKWPTHVQVSHYADVCQQRLERRLNGRRLDSVEPTIRDIDRSRVQIFRPSMFGSTLEEVMRRQKERFPNRRLPWILVTLCHEVLALGGAKTLGIFREAPDHRELDGVYDSLDQWQIPEWTNPLVPATVLKKWLSELYDPLIPTDVQQDLSTCPDDIDRIRTILSRLNPLSWLILGYLIRFLQTMCKSDNVENTRMTPYNLAVVFAPNLSPVTSLNPMQVQEDARRANAVIETLIRSLDTSFAEGLA